MARVLFGRQAILWQVFFLLLLLTIASSAQALDYVFQTSPPVTGAKVFVDGRSIGVTDSTGRLVIPGARPGEHKLRVEQAGTTIGSGSLSFDSAINVLDPLPVHPAAANSGGKTVEYIIDANVAGATVWVDGKAVGTTNDPGGRAVVSLTVGQRYQLRVSHEGFRSETQSIVASEIGNRAVFTLVPMPANAAGGARGSGLLASLMTTRALIWASAILAVVLAALVITLSIRRAGLRTTKARPVTHRTTSVFAFDRYRVSKVLGSGGVATIYKATDSQTGAPLALKLLDSKWIVDPEMVQKFLAESHALDAIHSVDSTAPVVRCLRSGREGGRPSGQPFIALELLEGSTLDKRLENGALSELEASGIGLQIARGLEVVHRAGIVHRDLSPDNIFLVRGEVRVAGRRYTGAPRVVLIDFGVARQEMLTWATLDGSIAGKPQYMSPEQCRSGKVDSRSDLYSFGIILYAMITGHPPFTGKNPFDVMRAQQSEAPPSLDGQASPLYRSMTLSMLAKNPSQRPQTAGSVAKQLESHFATLSSMV